MRAALVVEKLRISVSTSDITAPKQDKIPLLIG